MTKQFFTLALAVVILGGCASTHYHQGVNFYDAMAYNLAIQEFEKALAKKDIADARVKLADSYRMFNNTSKAEYWYEQSMSLPECSADDKMNYARMLMQNGKYEKAKEVFGICLKSNAENAEAKAMLASCDSIIQFKDDSVRYSLVKLNFNTGQSNMAPAYYEDGIVFASDRTPSKSVYNWTGKSYLDMYFTKKLLNGQFDSPKLMGDESNGIFHDGPCVFSKDGNTMYFTRNNYIKKKVKESEEDVVNLKIYKAEKTEGVWKEINPLSFCSDEYSTGHPSLNAEGTRMYFASDMPGTLGGTDIFYVDWNGSDWSAPVNMGASINTPMNELFPFIYQSNTLYFSSEGHTNMGGLDVFESVLEDGTWGQSVNLRYPINSSKDDFSYIIDENLDGFFTTNRNSTDISIDEIYSFRKNIFFMLKGIVLDKETNLPLQSSLVEVKNLSGGKGYRFYTDADGKFEFQIDKGTNYDVVGSRDCYFAASEQITTKGKKQKDTINVVLKLERIVLDKPIVMENIFYDFDKANIRPDAAVELDKLVTIMNDNPTITVELSSHTDMRGSDEYNQKLSQKRAESAVAYIISRGIEAGRITAMGYGESMLVNQCDDGVECEESLHQQNRRTEFKVTGFIQEVACK